MKYLAILKDSFREAVDTKVLYFTFGLASLVIVIVGSISFTPLDAERSFKTLAERDFFLVSADHGNSWQKRPFNAQYKIEKVEQLNDASSPPAGDYRILLRVERPDQFQQAVEYWSNPPSKSDKELLEQIKNKDAKNPDMTKILAEMAAQWLPFGPRKGATPAQVEDFWKGMFNLHGDVEVTKITQQSRQGSALMFEVTTRGKRAVLGWPHELGLLFGLLPMPFMRFSLSTGIMLITNVIVGFLGATVTILLSVIITAFFIPNMLQKGRIDLLLSKPAARTGLLVYKYLGGLSFILINTAFVVFGVFVMLGLRSGFWVTGFLWMIPILTFFFAILYAMSTLVAVLTRSVIVAILATIGFWVICFAVGTTHTALSFPGERQWSPWLYDTVDTIHGALPRTTELGELTDRLIVEQIRTGSEIQNRQFSLLPQPNYMASVLVSLAWIAGLLGLASWRFATKDY
jgi:ABC-type transport system involved in multi-copper enzyme maturation permease subunit